MKNSTPATCFIVFLFVLLCLPFSGRSMPGGAVSCRAHSSVSENWSWTRVGAIQGVNAFDNIVVDPQDERIWYVISIENGLYVTRDDGVAWSHAISSRGLGAEGLQIDPENPNIVYAAVRDKLYKSSDRGKNWNIVYTCPEYIRSVLVSKIDGSIYLGPQTETNASPGLYKSTDGGLHFNALPFGVATQYLICWDIVEDAGNNVLYVPVELADHPQPYSPPLFRSMDGGVTWQNIAFTDWHAQEMAVDARNGTVYFLKEGSVLYRSSNHGLSWSQLSSQPLFNFQLDLCHPGRVFGGSSYESGVRGAWMSENGGRGFASFGLDEMRVTGVAMNGECSKLYAATWGDGIWKTNAPDYVPSAGIRVANTLDGGLWSLREAIDLANRGVGADTIRFDISKSDPAFDPASGTWTILIAEDLPMIIDDSLFIDGYSQRQNRGEDVNPQGPEIILTPVVGNAVDTGLLVTSAYNRISHLVINSVNGSAIHLDGQSAQFNFISGCYIGTDAYGEVAMPNQFGIYLSNSSKNSIGSFYEIDRNIISGNTNHGLVIAGATSSENLIVGNFIGLTPNGGRRGNGSYGVFVSASRNTIAGNEIAYNGSVGIAVLSADADRITMSQNSIHDNLAGGILLFSGANGGIQPPVLSFSNGAVYGMTLPGATVELFSDAGDQGALFEGDLTADDEGKFVWANAVAGPYVTATATDAEGNTSAFSNALAPLVSGDETLFEVANTNPAGDGSLAAAMIAANDASGRKRIVFHIPKNDAGFDAATGVWTIKPAEAYIADTDSLTIDGRSQKEFIGEDTNPLGPEIAIDGSSLIGDGFTFNNVNRFRVYGLAVYNFQNGIYCRQVDGGVIAGCCIGTDAAGEDSLGNAGNGVYAQDSRSILIGGSGDSDGNLILGNPNGAVYVFRCSTVTIEGNLFDVNRSTQKTFSSIFGPIVSQRSDHVTISDNVIGGAIAGVTSWQSSELMIRNNFININRTWEKIGKLNVGVWLSDSSHDNIVANNNIGFCELYAIGLQDGAVRCRLTQNQLTGNTYTGIYLDATANDKKAAPTLLSATPDNVTGQAAPADTVEIFNDGDGQARLFLGAATADAAGRFSLTLPATPQLANVTATAANAVGNTSTLSAPIEINDTAVNEGGASGPARFYLSPNFPNPFNPSTAIRFGLQKNGVVDLRVYNMRGEEAALLLHERMTAGDHLATFDAGALPSGLYLLRLQAGGFERMEKMLLVR